MKNTKIIIALCIILAVVLASACQEKPSGLDGEFVAEQPGYPLPQDIGSGELQWEWFLEPGEYENIILLSEDMIGIQNGAGQYGFIDKRKALFVSHQYHNVLGIGENIARVIDANGNYVFLDREGKLSDKSFSDALDFSEGLAAVKQNDKWGFIDTNGTLVIDYQFDEVLEGFREGHVAVRKNKLWGFINTSGELAVEYMFDNVGSFNEDFAGVKVDGRWGFIDQTGKLCIELKYDEVGKFSEGKATVKSMVNGEEKWAYINKQDEIVIDYFQCDTSEGRMLTVGEFSNGYALVSKTLYCLIDEKGETVLGDNSSFLLAGSSYNEEYGIVQAYDYVDDAMTVKKYGFIDIDGNQKIPFVFDYVSDISGNLILVSCMNDGKLAKGIIALSQNSNKKAGQSFFFPEGTTEAVYKARFNYSGLTGFPDEITLMIIEKQKLEDGTMYELRIDYEDDFGGRFYYGWDRMYLGSFYVQEEKIIMFGSLNVYGLSETEMDQFEGTIVCQNKEILDKLKVDEKGWHEYMLAKDNIREYNGYSTLVDTGFYQTYIWEEGVGLIKYRSGFGAERDHVELTLIR